MNKLFVNVSIMGEKRLVKIVYDKDQPDVIDVKNAIENKYHLKNTNLFFYTKDKVIIEEDDVVDVIQQYKENVDFLLVVGMFSHLKYLYFCVVFLLSSCIIIKFVDYLIYL